MVNWAPCKRHLKLSRLRGLLHLKVVPFTLYTPYAKSILSSKKSFMPFHL